MSAWPSRAAMAAAVQRGEVAPEHWLELARARLEGAPEHSLAHRVSEEDVSAQLAALRERIRAEEALPLAGIPVAIKGNLCVRGWETACGSRMLRGWVAPYDATVVERLRDAGALLVASSALDEFAMGSLGEGVRHPRLPGRAVGGSSSGSAALVAAGCVPLAIGSDTGGSVRLPAAWCGISGLLPGYGQLSRYGLVAHASSLDTVGLLATNAEDLSGAYRALTGIDPRDATSLPAPAPLADGPFTRVLVPPEPSMAEWHPEVRAAVKGAAEALARRGHDLDEARLIPAETALAAYALIAAAEAASNLARFDGLRYGHRCEDAADQAELLRRTRAEGFGREVRRRIRLGTLILSKGERERVLARARRVAARLREELREQLGSDGVLLTATAPCPPLPLTATLRPHEVWMLDRLTVPASLAGLPALAVPAAPSAADVPEGRWPPSLQLVGPPGSAEALCALGRELQEQPRS